MNNRAELARELLDIMSRPPSKKTGNLMIDQTKVYDCTGANLASFNVATFGRLAGYVTGTDGVPWTDAQFAAYPHAVRIDQSPMDTPQDETADVLDVEPQAGTIADIPAWVHGAWTSFRTARRPGQRTPCIYVNESELTPAVNMMNANGITNGVSIWLAKPMPEQDAMDMLDAAGGPFPIVGVQYEFHDNYDVSWFSTEWLNNVSTPTENPPNKPSLQDGWRFCIKCQGLFYGPGEQQSMCPRGGTHDGSHSHDYVLEIDQ